MTCCEKNMAAGACEMNAGNADKAASCPFLVYLANLAVWNVKLHNLHWNVVGSAFVQVHEYTEGLYDEVNEQFDAVAEACKMRGKFPVARMADYLKMATIKEIEVRDYPVSEVLQIVESDMRLMQALAQEIRKGADEFGDYLLVSQFEDYLAKYAKDLWFLSAMQKSCCKAK